METGLHGPYFLELVDVILTIEYSIPKASVRIFLNLPDKHLTNSHPVEVQFLTTIAYGAEQSAKRRFLSIDILKDAGKHFEINLLLGGLLPIEICLLEAFFSSETALKSLNSKFIPTNCPCLGLVLASQFIV